MDFGNPAKIIGDTRDLYKKRLWLIKKMLWSM